MSVIEQPEARLLAACAAARGDGLSDAALGELVAAGVDWTALIELALRHGVAPALALALGRADSGLVPPEILVGLRQYVDAARAGNINLAVELHAILAALSDSGVTALPFKGPLLTALLYGDLGQRAPGDLDFLVRRADVTRTCEVLRSRGYRDAHRSPVPMTATQHDVYRRYQCEYQFIRDSDGVVAEPHWALDQAMGSGLLDYEAHFARARRGDLAGVSVPMHAPEDLLLVLCVHGAKHQWERLVWIRDVAALLARSADLDLDVDVALARAREQGCARLVLVALEVTHRLLDAPLPSGVHQAIREDVEVAALAEEVTSRLFLIERSKRTNRQVTGFAFRMHEGAARRARYVARTLLLPRREHIEMVALPASLVWLYYPLRWGHDYVARPVWNLVVTFRRRRTRDRHGTARYRPAR